MIDEEHPRLQTCPAHTVTDVSVPEHHQVCTCECATCDPVRPQPHTVIDVHALIFEFLFDFVEIKFVNFFIQHQHVDVVVPWNRILVSESTK